MVGHHVTRRKVLQTLGAGAIGTAGLGTASAQPDDAYVVGVSNDRGRGDALAQADAVKRELDFGGLGKAVAGRFSPRAVEALQRNPHVRYVEPDREYRALAETLPWGVDRVDADVAHANGDTGAGADVAIVDTGIDSDHPDLQANLGSGTAFVDCTEGGGGPWGGGNGNDCFEPWDDDNDHGTHCAGTADAVDNDEGVVGVSTEATLHAVKVLDSSGSGSLSDVAAGIEYVADQGWDVASMSLGASSGDQTLQDACQYAADNGVLLVAAAGNSGPCSDCVGYPAAYDTVIAVSSTDSDDSLSSFSSTGSEVDLAAPGGEVYSTVAGGYDTFSGTSMACPHVAGAGGQLMASGMSASEARSALQSSAEDIGLGSNEQGYGLLDVEAALDGDGGSGGDNSAPACSIATPGDGSTVSGTVTVQVDASDAEDDAGTLDVTVSVDGGAAQTAAWNSSTGYYEYDWDTTGASDGDHSVDATATDSAGASTSASTVTVTVDNGGSGGDTAPAIDTFGVADRSNGGWARFEVDWAVSDADGDLASVDLELLQDGTADSTSVSVGGSTASGSDRLQDKKGSGSYDVVLTVTDGNGNTASQTKTRTTSR